MANGLSSNYEDDQAWITSCFECNLEEECCDEACEGRIWVAKCGTIDYATGEILAPNNFCEPKNVTAFSHSDNATIREKQYRGCKKYRKRGQPDTQFTLSWDICQSDAAQAFLLSSCSFDYVIAPKGNNLNFELNPSIRNQKTMVFWGRTVGDSFTWEYPDDDCQNTSRTFMTDGYCWMGQVESLQAGVAPKIVIAKNSDK